MGDLLNELPGADLSESANSDSGRVTASARVENATNSVIAGVYFAADQREITWPIQIGVVPRLAASYQPRTEPQRQLNQPIATPNITRVLTGLGGNGKTQIAAEYARRRFDNDELDLLVWATASGRDPIVSAYAHAARAVGAADARANIEEAAGAFLNWLERTDKRWLIMLDDVADPKDLTALWPAGAAGDVVITSQRRDQTLSANGRIRIDVDLFAHYEAHAYLAAKLNPDQLTGSHELAAALGYLPLACAQAAAVLNETGETCAAYRDLFADQRQRLLDLLPPDALADDYGRETIATTRQMAVDAADKLRPIGRARPLLELAAYLDPNGMPVVLFTDDAARAYVDAETRLDERQVRQALGNLSRLSLVELDALSNQATTVRVHGLVQRAVRETIEGPGAALAAADALFHIWPGEDFRTLVGTGLRANAVALLESAEAALLSHETGSNLVSFVGVSLLRAGLIDECLAFCEHMLGRARATVGNQHPTTFALRVALSRALLDVEQNERAIELLEELIADAKNSPGADERMVIAATNNLGAAYLRAGRRDEAIRLFERALRANVRLDGADSPSAMMGQAGLAVVYLETDRPAEALPFAEGSVALGSTLFGDRNPSTLHARDTLAKVYLALGRVAEAIELSRRNLADNELVLGMDHLDTMMSRVDLGVMLAEIGELDEAVTLLHRSEREVSRALGQDHSRALLVRGVFAKALVGCKRYPAAQKYLASTVDGYERTLGFDHPITQQTRADLTVVRDLLAGNPPG